MITRGVVVRVPAKVNLQLAVGPREADGFHNLVTVFQAISIYDDVTITKGAPGSGITISIVGDHTHGVPADATNLAVKAAQGSLCDYRSSLRTTSQDAARSSLLALRRLSRSRSAFDRRRN